MVLHTEVIHFLDVEKRDCDTDMVCIDNTTFSIVPMGKRKNNSKNHSTKQKRITLYVNKIENKVTIFFR